MQKIFKLSTTNDNVSEAGFTEHYAEIDVNTSYAEINPHIEDAITQYILPYIGKPFYNTLADKIQNATTLTEPEAEAIRLLRRATAYYAATLWIPLKHTLTASAGVVQNNTNRANTASLSSTKFSLWKITLQADTHLDNLLAFIEQQVAFEDADFDDWKNDPAYTNGTSPFFRRTADLQRYFNIFNSRPTFLSLISHINDICEDVITPILCDDLFLEIKNQITSGDMTPANIRLIHLIRRTIAPMAVAKAAPFLSIIVESDGLKVVSNSEGMDRREIAIKQHQAKIQDLVNRCNSDAQKSLDKLKKHINDNIADYPLYQSSRCYAAAQARLKGFGVNVVTDLGKSAFIYKKR